MKPLKLLSPHEESNREASKSNPGLMVTKQDLHEMECRLERMLCMVAATVLQVGRNMEQAVQTYVDAVNAAFDSISTGVDTAVTGVAGVQKDVTDLKAIIDKLQNSPGTITPEDQATLDAGQAKAAAAVAKVSALSKALSDLDAQTETAPPTPTP